MAKPRPEDFPNVRGDAQMLPYFKWLKRVPLKYSMSQSKLPAIPAIYFIYAEPDIIVYIGKTINLKSRWASGHQLFRWSMDKTLPKVFVVWMPCDVRMLDVLEQFLIRKLRPVSNTKHCSNNYHSFSYEIKTRRSPEWTIS